MNRAAATALLRRLKLRQVDPLYEEALLMGIIALQDSPAGKPIGWLPLDDANAPQWFYGRGALVGTWTSEGWIKVSLWEPSWTRDEIIERGGTHWWQHLPFPESPAQAGQSEPPLRDSLGPAAVRAAGAQNAAGQDTGQMPASSSAGIREPAPAA